MLYSDFFKGLERVQESRSEGTESRRSTKVRCRKQGGQDWSRSMDESKNEDQCQYPEGTEQDENFCNSRKRPKQKKKCDSRSRERIAGFSIPCLHRRPVSLWLFHLTLRAPFYPSGDRTRVNGRPRVKKSFSKPSCPLCTWRTLGFYLQKKEKVRIEFDLTKSWD